jgi:hypothetical protein
MPRFDQLRIKDGATYIQYPPLNGGTPLTVTTVTTASPASIEPTIKQFISGVAGSSGHGSFILFHSTALTGAHGTAGIGTLSVTG